MALRLGIDIDGVLADFRNAFRETARECLRREVLSDALSDNTLSHVDIDRVWNHIARRPNWWMTLRAYEPAAIANLYALARSNRWEVCFLTKRPASAGDSVQFQTQWWLEQQGFYLPAVITVPGSRGDLANALRLDLAIDDQFVNCAEIIGAGPTKALLMLRDPNPTMQRHAVDRGVGVVATLAETLPILQQFYELLQTQRGRMIRLSEWFRPKTSETLPQNPRSTRPIPDESQPAKPVG
jgi:deoxypyrimidine-specific 5' nucleotidase type C protein (NT5C)